MTASQGSRGKLTATRAGRDKEGISFRASGGRGPAAALTTDCLPV